MSLMPVACVVEGSESTATGYQSPRAEPIIHGGQRKKDSKFRFWLSHNTHNGPGLSTEPLRLGDTQYRVRMVSVVLDGQARLEFDRIRIRVVVGSRSGLDGVTINECADPLRDLGFPQEDDPGYRCRLERRRVDMEASLEDMKALQEGHHRQRVCNIFLELIPSTDTRSEWWYRAGVNLVPRVDLSWDATNTNVNEGSSNSFSKQRYQDSDPNQHFTVIFDQIRKCTPTDPGVLLFLESNRLFRPLPGTSYLYNIGQPGVSMLTIRVVPYDRGPTTAGKRSSTSSGGDWSRLPTKIITQIVESSIIHRAPHWRFELLSYGLVCKSWVHVLDLFFRILGTAVNSDPSTSSWTGSIPSNNTASGHWRKCDPPDLHRVARSLKRRPDRARLMKVFGDDYFKKERYRLDEVDWKELVGILERLSSGGVKGVVLGNVPGYAARELRKGLQRLRGVKRFVVGDLGWCKSNSSAVSMLDMRTLQGLMGNWWELRTVDLTNWQRPKKRSRSIYQTSPPLPCKIEELRLWCGYITSSQIKRFASTYNPCLKLLRLYKVEGISNAGLSSFLSIVAPTLVVLEISHCQFTHYGEEENAVDEVMEKLESLQQLLITGPGIVTALALSRKRTFVSQVQGSTSSGSPGQIRGSKKRCAIVVSSATEEMRMEEMARALETTAWNSVSIHWKRIDLEHQIGAGAQTHSQTHAQAAVQKATEKAITISFTSGEFGISLGSNVNV